MTNILYPSAHSPSVSGSFTSENDTSNPNLEGTQALRFGTSQPEEDCATVATTALSDFLVFKDL
jgi:hypothetical protein